MTDRREPLTRAQLAEESDVAEAYIDQLAELSILHPKEGTYGLADVWRVRTMRSLESAGMTLERMAPHFQSGRLSLGFLEAALPPPAPRTGLSFEGFVDSLGERGPLVETVYEMLGLVRPPDA